MIKRNGTQTEGNELFYLTHNLFIKLVGFYPEEKTNESLSTLYKEIEKYRYGCFNFFTPGIFTDSEYSDTAIHIGNIANDVANLAQDLQDYTKLSAYKVSKIILPVIYHLIAMLMPLFEEDDIYRAGYNEEVYEILNKIGDDNQKQE